MDTRAILRLALQVTAILADSELKGDDALYFALRTIANNLEKRNPDIADRVGYASSIPDF